MNMNREAVDAALGLAGNMPLTDEDKQYGNLVYVFCKNLYLPVLFASLCGIDRRCARKYGALREAERYAVREPGMYYCETPSDCVRPLLVDGNSDNFRNDRHFIITGRPAARLYCVFHKRSLANLVIEAPDAAEGRDNMICIDRPDTAETALGPASLRSRFEEEPPADSGGFPEWEYTPYDADFWTYFSYRPAAALVPKLRAGGGAAGRAQALEAPAARKGGEAVQRSRAAASNPRGQHRSRAELCGLEAAYGNRAVPAAAFTGRRY